MKKNKKQQHKDWKKRRNILVNWQRQQKNRREKGLSLKRMPTDFPKSKKVIKSKKIIKDE